MPRIAQFGLIALALSVIGGCTKPTTTDTGGIEGTNAAAKQGWEKPRTAADLDQLRNRLAHTQIDN